MVKSDEVDWYVRLVDCPLVVDVIVILVKRLVSSKMHVVLF